MTLHNSEAPLLLTMSYKRKGQLYQVMNVWLFDSDLTATLKLELSCKHRWGNTPMIDYFFKFGIILPKYYVFILVVCYPLAKPEVATKKKLNNKINILFRKLIKNISCSWNVYLKQNLMINGISIWLSKPFDVTVSLGDIFVNGWVTLKTVKSRHQSILRCQLPSVQSYCVVISKWWISSIIKALFGIRA